MPTPTHPAGPSERTTTPWPQGTAPRPAGAYSLTLRDVYDQLVKLQKQLPPTEDSAALHRIADSLKRQKTLWMPVAWFVSCLSLVFGAGMAWAVFAGENATDAEVATELERAFGGHNADLTEQTHPDVKHTLSVHTEELEQLKQQTKAMDATLQRLDLRSLYQFEVGRWQADIIECQKNKHCRKPLKKPRKVRDLESELMNR